MVWSWWCLAALAKPLVVDLPDLCVAGGLEHPAKACPGLPPLPETANPTPATPLLWASVPDGEGQAVLMVYRVDPTPGETPDRAAAARDLIAGYVGSFGSKVEAASALPTQGIANPMAPYDLVELRGVPAVRFAWNDVVTTQGALLFTEKGMVAVTVRSLEGSDAAATLFAAAIDAIEAAPAKVVDSFDPAELRPPCLPPGAGATTVGPRYRPYAFEPPPGPPARRSERSVRYPILDGSGHLLVSVDPAGIGIDGNSASDADKQQVLAILTQGLVDRAAEDVRGEHRTTRGCTHFTAEGRFGDAKHRIDWVLDGRTVVGVECRAPVARDEEARALCEQVFDSLAPTTPVP